MVGLIPLFAAESLEATQLSTLPLFRSRLEWFVHEQARAGRGASRACTPTRRESTGSSALPRGSGSVRVLRYLLDEHEFLSPFGIRSLSKVHREQPVVLQLAGQRLEVRLRARRVATRGCSAATPTGAARSGSR